MVEGGFYEYAGGFAGPEVVEEVAAVDEGLALVCHDLCDLFVRVSERVDRDPGGKVEVLA